MAQDVKIIANVGYLKGYSGIGNIFAARAENGSYLFALLSLENNVEKWKYYRKSRIETGFQGGEVVMTNDLNWSQFTDAVTPEFVTASADPFPEITTVTNGDGMKRLYDLEPAYTLKGEGIVTADIDKLKMSSSNTNGTGTTPGTGTGTTPGTTTGAVGGLVPTDFGLLFTNPIKFVQDNPLFIGIVLAVIYFIRQKKKKPLWLF